MHHEVPALRGADRATDRGLPFLEVLLGLREFLDVFGGVLERDELATGQGNRFVEFARPVSHAATTA
jgi:hypothetical protein